MKWWVWQRKQRDPDFRFKSFMVELILCRMNDDGVKFDDYPTLLESFFQLLITDRFASQIAFTDYHQAADSPDRGSDPIQVLDPVNPTTTTARYTTTDRDRLLAAAQDAYDAITEARFATTKTRAIACWREVLGPQFGA